VTELDGSETECRLCKCLFRIDPLIVFRRVSVVHATYSPFLRSEALAEQLECPH
jgi:hypothetical protein